MANQRGASFTFRRCNVFSTFKADTPHSPPVKKYWFVEARENGGLTIQALDEMLWLPIGVPKVFNARALQTGNYKPEPEVYAEYVAPMLESMENTPESDESPSVPNYDLALATESGEESTCPAIDDVLTLPLLSPHPELIKTSLYSEEEILEATGCYEKIEIKTSDALEGAMRGMFKTALAYIEQNQLSQAEHSLQKILALKQVVKARHKHIFNEFGIMLRRNGMYAWSVDFYTMAIELSGDFPDENILINMARSLFRLQRYLACTQYLFKALRIEPRHWAVMRFLAWMQQERVVPKEYLLDVRALLSQGLPPIPLNMRDFIAEEKKSMKQRPAHGAHDGYTPFA